MMMHPGYNRGRGGFKPNNSSMPSDTIHIHVTDIRQPVTEDVMRRVFESVGVSTRNVQVFPSNNTTESHVQAQFSDQFAAERVMSSLNNRNIFNNANKMSMNYAPPMGGSAGGMSAVLPTPQAPMQFNHPNNQFQQQQQQQPPQFNNMQQQQQPPQQQGFNPMGGRGGYNPQFQRGGRGAGRGFQRGGRGGFGYNNNMAGNQFNPMGGMGGGRGGYNNNMGNMMPYPNMMMQQGSVMMPPMQNQPTVFLSVTLMPLAEPLMNAFVLMEAYGGVVSMRRNQKQKDILTVKMASIADAEALVRFLRRVPFAGGTISAKRFPTYVERNPCTDEGDPLDPECSQFDFTAARHRSPGQRSHSAPSTLLKITGCAEFSEADLMTYLNSKNFFPEKIVKDIEGTFKVQVADADTAVKLLVACHGNVCGEERSNVIFIEGPVAEPTPGAEQQPQQQQQQPQSANEEEK